MHLTPSPNPSRSSRSISPVGASRFERPYSPPRPTTRHSPTSTTPTPTPTAQTQTQTMHFSSRQPRHHPSTSVFSHADTIETAPTNLSFASARASKDEDSDEGSNTHVVSPDDWFARFHSDPSLAETQSDHCPDRATLAAVQNIPIFSAPDSSQPFGSLYEPSLATHPRQLIIFIRHFFCGACQAYIQALTEQITPSEYFSIPTPTSIIIIGCGSPEMIQHYKRFTKCPFPLYADPSRSLFKKLGMNLTANFGNHRPEYMKGQSWASWMAGQAVQITTEVRKEEGGIRKRDAFKGGNLMQIGGEFLFEEGEVVWCHRMRNMRDHVEVKVVRKLLELDP